MLGEGVEAADTCVSGQVGGVAPVVVPHRAPPVASRPAPAPVMPSPMQAALSTAAALAAASCVGTKEMTAATEQPPQLPPSASLPAAAVAPNMPATTQMLPLQYPPPPVGTASDGSARSERIFPVNPQQQQHHHPQQPTPATSDNEPPSVFAQMKLRRGKWTPEEETYADLLIAEFERGTVEDCENGCTLRAFLSKKLHCAPMRISKKYAGKSIGKHVFLARKNIPGAAPTPSNRVKLRELELAFYQSLLHDDRRHPTTTAAVTAYLAAVAAAAAPTALAYRTLHTPNSVMGPTAMSTATTTMGHHSGQMFTHYPQQLHGTAAAAIPYVTSARGAPSVPGTMHPGAPPTSMAPGAATAIPVGPAPNGYLSYPIPGQHLMLTQRESAEQQKKQLQQTYLSALHGNGKAPAIAATTTASSSASVPVVTLSSASGLGSVQMPSSAAIPTSKAPTGADAPAPVSQTTNQQHVSFAPPQLPLVPVPAHQQQSTTTTVPTVSFHPISAQHHEPQQQPSTARRLPATVTKTQQQDLSGPPTPVSARLEIPDFLVGFEKVAASKHSVTAPTAASVAPIPSSPPLTSRSFDDFHKYLGKGLSPSQPLAAPLGKAVTIAGQGERLAVPTFGPSSAGSRHLQNVSSVSADCYAAFAQESAHAVMQHSAYNDHSSAGPRHQRQEQSLPQLAVPNVIEDARQAIVSSPSPMNAANLRVHHELHQQQEQLNPPATQQGLSLHHHHHHVGVVVSEQSEEGGDSSEDSNSEQGTAAASGVRKRKRETAEEGEGRLLALITDATATSNMG